MVPFSERFNNCDLIFHCLNSKKTKLYTETSFNVSDAFLKNITLTETTFNKGKNNTWIIGISFYRTKFLFNNNNFREKNPLYETPDSYITFATKILIGSSVSSCNSSIQLSFSSSCYHCISWISTSLKFNRWAFSRVIGIL